MKILMNGLSSVCLLLFLSACNTTPEVLTEVRVERIYPPAVLLESHPTPVILGQTNADLLNWALELHNALERCEIDKSSLRQWRARELEHGESNKR